jgi:peroxiredoxin
MAIQAGDRIPAVDVQVMGPEGRPETVSTGDVLGKGRVVLFAVPGAFTPGCSRIHLPGYVQGAGDLGAKGVDRIACVAVNDAWVMDAWAKDQGAHDKILMLADGSAFFTEAMGMEFDRTPNGMGVRSKRYSALIEDGVVKNIDVDESGAVESSACEVMLERL